MLQLSSAQVAINDRYAVLAMRPSLPKAIPEGEIVCQN